MRVILAWQNLIKVLNQIKANIPVFELDFVERPVF